MHSCPFDTPKAFLKYLISLLKILKFKLPMRAAQKVINLINYV